MDVPSVSIPTEMLLARTWVCCRLQSPDVVASVPLAQDALLDARSGRALSSTEPRRSSQIRCCRGVTANMSRGSRGLKCEKPEIDDHPSASRFKEGSLEPSPTTRHFAGGSAWSRRANSPPSRRPKGKAGAQSETFLRYKDLTTNVTDDCYVVARDWMLRHQAPGSPEELAPTLTLPHVRS